jgi:hypothetical protein
MPIRMTLPTHFSSEPHARAQAFAHVQSVRRHKPPHHKFDYPTELVGSTPDGKVTLYYDPQLGAPGKDLAEKVFAMAEKTFADCQNFFGIAGQPVNVIIAPLNHATDGSAGAYHAGCSFNPGGDLYCDAAFGNPVMTNGLVVAELTECFMGAQNKGWDCGGSNGEALSRLLAEIESGGPAGALAAYATGPAWDHARRPNWIDATESTDTDAVSTGCGIVYLYWMMSKGYTAAKITQAGCPDGSLASNYHALTGQTTAWSDFIAAVRALPHGITSDNPWGAAVPVA